MYDILLENTIVYRNSRMISYNQLYFAYVFFVKDNNELMIC